MANVGIGKTNKVLTFEYGTLKILINPNKQNASFYFVTPCVDYNDDNPFGLSFIINGKTKAFYRSDYKNITLEPDGSYKVVEFDGQEQTYRNGQFSTKTGLKFKDDINGNTAVSFSDFAELNSVQYNKSGNSISNYPSRLINNDKITNVTSSGNIRTYSLEDIELKMTNIDTSSHFIYKKNNVVKSRLIFEINSSGNYRIERYDVNNKCYENYSIVYGTNTIDILNIYNNKKLHIELENGNIKRIQEKYDNNSSIVLKNIELSYLSTSNDVRVVSKEILEGNAVRLKEHYLDVYYDSNNYPIFEMDDEGNFKYYKFNAYNKLLESSDFFDTRTKLVNSFSAPTSYSGVNITNASNSNTMIANLYSNEKRYTLSSSGSYGKVYYKYNFSNGIGNKPYTFALFIKPNSPGNDIRIYLKTNNQTISKSINMSATGKYQLIVISIQDEKSFDYVEASIESNYSTFSICRADLFEGKYVYVNEYNTQGFITKESCGNVSNTYIYDDKKRLIKKTIAGEISRSISYNEDDYINVSENENSLTKITYDNNCKVVKKTETIGLFTNDKIVKENNYRSDNELDNYYDENGYHYSYIYDSHNEIISSTDLNNLCTTIDLSSYSQKDEITWSKDGISIKNAIAYNSNNDVTKYEHNNVERYCFEYDNYRNIDIVEIDGSTIVNFDYDYYLDEINKITFSDNSYTNIVYNDEKQVSSISHSNGEQFSYEYDSNNRIKKIKKNNIVKSEFTYNKDELVQLIEDGLTKRYTAFENGNNVIRYDSIIQENFKNINTNVNKYYFLDFENDYLFNGDTPKAECNTTISNNKSGSNLPRIISVGSTYNNTKMVSINGSLLRYNTVSGSSGTVGFIYYRNNANTTQLLTLCNYSKLYSSNNKDTICVCIENGYLKVKVSKNLNYSQKYSVQAVPVGEWDLLGVSWNKKDNSKFDLYLHNNEDKVLVAQDLDLYADFGYDLKIYLGSDGNSTSVANDTYYKNLFVSKAGMLEEGIINCVLQKINCQLGNKEEKQIARIENNKLIDNSNNFNIYPLHTDYKSIKGDLPYIYEAKRANDNSFDSSFSFNEVNNKTTYHACGQKLAYKFNLDNMGTIMMNVLFNYELDRRQVVLEHYLSNGVSIKVCREDTNLVLYINGLVCISLGGVNVLSWNVVGLSFWKESETVGYSTIDYNYFRLYLNGNISSNYRTLSLMPFTNAVTYIGSDHNFVSSKLNGYIEMLCAKDSICSRNTMDKTLEGVSYGYDVNKEYDEFGRLNKSEIKHINQNIITNEYSFKKNRHNVSYSSLMVDEEKIELPNSISTRKYDYNSSGQVSSITDSLFGNRSYTYNYKGFIETETINGQMYSYNYDDNGNIASIVKPSSSGINSNNDSQQTRTRGFNISPQAAVLPPIIGGGGSTITTSLEYTNVVKDLVSKIGSDIIAYSGLYPTNYRGKQLSWNSNRLISCNDYTFEYNHKNLLTEVRQNGTTISHLYYEENKLIKEVDSSYSYPIYYLYDNNGLLYGLKYHDEIYFYIRDALQNILGLVDSDGRIVVKYFCTAYGEQISCTDTSGFNLGEINKFRYKGYYYEKHIGLFYLKSRFYDPTIGRFISPDSIDYVDPRDINGLNLYAYCNNNPVNYCDPSGHSAILIGLLIGAILLFTPVGGVVAQAVTSVGCYAGMAIASIWNEDIRNDMNAIGWNPFNSNESSVLNASTVSFYKGVPVFKIKNDRSGSFGAIFLADWSREDDLRHERGHNWQLMMMGIGTYAFTVGIPSPLMLGGWNKRDKYYCAPWETLADILGGVKERSHSKNEIINAWLYYGLGHFLIPSIFFWF